jgi:Bacterial regulatory proteins, gntR family
MRPARVALRKQGAQPDGTTDGDPGATHHPRTSGGHLRSRYRTRDGLTEEPLARLLGSSRESVRAAIQTLLAEGLVRRTGHRGTVVGPEGVTVLRTPLAESLAGLALLQEPKVSFAWQTLYDEVEARVVHRAFFGRTRIN